MAMTEHPTLAAALAAVQAALPTVHKGNRATVPTKAGGSYSYTYADLSDVTAAALPLLSAHGLAWLCKPRLGEKGWELVGTLLHTSGEREEGTLPLAGSTPQEWGSSITYMRRYLLGSMTGLVTDDDDDGNTASRPKPPRKPTTRPAHTETGELRTEEQSKAVWAAAQRSGLTAETFRAYLTDLLGHPVDSTKNLTRDEASRVLDDLNGQP